MASDDPTYQAWVTEVMAAQHLFDAPPPATQRPADWPPTRYEAKALREGRSPLYLAVYPPRVKAASASWAAHELGGRRRHRR